MHSSKTLSLFKKINLCGSRISSNFVQRFTSKRIYSTNKSSVEESTETESSVADEDRKVMHGPFMKNIFAGTFDTSLLEYPEYTKKEYVTDVNNMAVPVEEFLLNCVDSKLIDEQQQIPQDVIDNLKEYKLYGLQASKNLGGLQLDERSVCRLGEAIGSDFSIATSFIEHNRALNALLIHGSEIQKTNYVPKLASGEFSMSFSILEKPNVFDIAETETTAIPNDNGDWLLNGKKIWVAKADCHLVLAKTWLGSVTNDSKADMTLFLVDKNLPGIERGPPIEKLGARGVEVSDIVFQDVVIPKENVLGQVGKGSEITFEAMCKSQLASAASTVGYLKFLFNTVTEYLSHTKTAGKPLSNFDFYKRQLGLMAADIYTLESMVYLTAGLRDSYDNPDLSVEESLIKIFSVEKVAEITDMCVNIIGGSAFIKGSFYETCIRNSRSFLMHDVVPINVTKIFISTLGLQHAGTLWKGDIKKSRNPFDFPGYILKSVWKESSALDDAMKIPHQLRLQLHPSLGGFADKLERSAIRFEAVVKNLLRRWGLEIIDRQTDLVRLADCAVSLYAMTAVLGRASRSYCIGLRHNQIDASLSGVICNIHHDKVKDIIEGLFEGPVYTNDAPLFEIAEYLASNKGYCCEHPLARNY